MKCFNNVLIMVQSSILYSRDVLKRQEPWVGQDVA